MTTTTYLPAKGGSILTPQIQDSEKVLTIRREGSSSAILRIRVLKAGNQNRLTTLKRV